MLTVRKKWRPSLWGIVFLVVLTLVMLPLMGLLGARLTSNQFVRETESSLNHQAALFASTFADAYVRAGGNGIEKTPSAKGKLIYAQKYHPIQSTLRAQDVLPQPAEPELAFRPIKEPYRTVGEYLSILSTDAQATTLAGFKALDGLGRVIGGTGVVGYSMAHIPEIQTALRGEPTSVLRYRSDQTNNHPLKSLSRDTSYRVFVAQPVIVDGYVVGAVYLSRTPLNLGKFLYQEAPTLLVLAGTILIGAFFVGFLLWRLISGPLKELEVQSLAIAEGEEDAFAVLGHYGTREVAALGQSFATMAMRLKQRSEALQAYSSHVTHELKSPVSSILGAAELLDSRGADMTPDTRQKFYGNIRQDAVRMTRLLDDLRTLARVRVGSEAAECSLSDVINSIAGDYPELRIVQGLPTGFNIPLSFENTAIVLRQLFQNSGQHGATSVELSSGEKGIVISDNGSGLSKGNGAAIFDPFFTTKRDDGGTGMGLAIVKGLLEAHNGRIETVASDKGAVFEIWF